MSGRDAFLPSLPELLWKYKLVRKERIRKVLFDEK